MTKDLKYTDTPKNHFNTFYELQVFQKFEGQEISPLALK